MNVVTFIFLSFVAFVSVSSAQDESVNARSTDTQENAWIDDLLKRYLEEDEQEAAGLNERRVSLDKPLDLAADAPAPAPRRDQLSVDAYLDHITRSTQAQRFGTFIEAVPPTLGDLLKERMRVSAAAVKDYLASLVSGSSATHSPPQSFPQPQVSDYEDRTLFRDELAGFEVAYPKTWERNPLVKGKRLAIRNSDTNKLGVISISVANAKNDLADAEKFKAYFKDQLPAVLVKGMKDRFGNGELIQSDEKVLSGYSAVLLVVSYDIQQPTGELTIVSAQLHCLRNGKIYTLNFESPANSFEDNWATFEKVMTTFNFR